MKNKNLKNLMALKVSDQGPTNEITILNKDELLYAMGGYSVSCPMLTSCGSFSDCNDKCAIKGITVSL